MICHSQSRLHSLVYIESLRVRTDYYILIDAFFLGVLEGRGTDRKIKTSGQDRVSKEANSLSLTLKKEKELIVR